MNTTTEVELRRSIPLRVAVRRQRRALDLTQEQVAQRAGLASRQLVHRVEAGLPVREETLNAVLRALAKVEAEEGVPLGVPGFRELVEALNAAEARARP